MTNAELSNRLTYGLIAILVALGGIAGAAVGAGLVPGFRDGDMFAPVRLEVAGAVAIMVSAGGQWLSANQPRAGSEHLAAQVDELHKAGVKKRDMVVVDGSQRKVGA